MDKSVYNSKHLHISATIKCMSKQMRYPISIYKWFSLANELIKM